MSDTHPEHADDRNGHEILAPVSPLDAQQRLMTQWIELQMRQVEMSGRFLESHERIALACLTGGDAAVMHPLSSSRSAAVTRGVERQPSPPSAPRQPQPAVAPPARPVLPAGARAAPSSNGNGRHAVAGVALAATPVVPAPSPIARGGTADSGADRFPRDAEPGEPPPTDRFRRDLIAAVAERTGYPVEMLKEDALLEADLGIDSIKTVEIFGSLTEYHRFMPGGGGFDEELLAEFAQLKTLGDIIAMYDRGRSGGTPGAAVRVATPAGEPRVETLPAHDIVKQRAADTTTAAALTPVTSSTKRASASSPAAPVTAEAAVRPDAPARSDASAKPDASAALLERLEVRPVPAPPVSLEKKNFPLTTSS